MVTLLKLFATGFLLTIQSRELIGLFRDGDGNRFGMTNPYLVASPHTLEVRDFWSDFHLADLTCRSAEGDQTVAIIDALYRRGKFPDA